jgi:alpha-L-rhamnosidase
MILSDKFISATEKYAGYLRRVPASWFKKDISFKGDVKKAAITVCGLGFYEMYLDGRKITKGRLCPYISNPDQVMFYDDYDITGLVSGDRCELKFLLGNGMQNAFGGFIWDFHKAGFRSAPKLAFAVEILYADGTVQVIEADESVLTRPSKIIRDDLRLGEIYDATFNEGQWKNAIKATTPKGEKRLSDIKPIVVRDKLTPVKIWKENNSYIYDFGINTAGVCELKINARKNQKVKLTFAEILKDGKFYRHNTSFKHSQHKYFQRDTYICKEGENIWSPTFTYHGFRYVKVEGITKNQATEDLLTYIVFNTELDKKGEFTCDDEKINTLHKMSLNSTLSNFHHFPTDCPQREKNGWTADAALSSSHALLYFEPTANYKQWLTAICKAQDERGALPGIVPTSGWGFAWGNGPAWDAVLTELPWQIWQKRNDISAFKECKDYIIKYLKYLETRMDEKGLLAIGLGDWCAPAKSSPLILTDSIEAYDIADKSRQMFEKISDTENADYCRAFAEKMRENIRTHLFDKQTGTFEGGYQTSQAMGIYYGIVNPDEKDKALAVLLNRIKEDGYHLYTGVLGGRVIFHVLAENGEIDTAVRMLENPTRPSYMQWIDYGETALCEGFGEGNWIDSRNHHFWGNISAFFMEQICGIKVSADTVKIEPFFPTNMNEASASFDSIYGRISASWKRENGRITYSLEYPQKAKEHIVISVNGADIKIKEV